MECEDNLPAPRESFIDTFEVGSFLLGREPAVDVYYRLAKALAGHYGITLCDEPEAVLIGSAVWSDVFFNRGTEIADMDVQFHLSFLRSYLNLHGLTSADTSPVVQAVLDWKSRGMTGDVYDYVTGEYSIETSVVVAEIRRLAGAHSIATPQQTPAVQAPPGGVIVRGSEFDFPACNPADATTFRSNARRRVTNYYSEAAAGTASGGTPGSASMRYQVNKCGNREYSMRTDAARLNRKPMADGLAPTRPPRAKSGFGFACCILEAKYVFLANTTLYQRRRDFMRNSQKYGDRLPRRLRGLARPALRAAWEAGRASQASQFGLYMGAIVDPEIPYWRVVYICSRENARQYFQDIINVVRVPRSIAIACVSSARRTTENWKV